MTLQVPPASDLTLGVVCTDKSTPGRTTWVVDETSRLVAKSSSTYLLEQA